MNHTDSLQDEPLQSLVKQCREDFVRCHDAQPDFVVAAPGRVNLIGEHTDYNEGFVLPMAIERYVVVAGRETPRARPERLRITSMNIGDTADIPYHSKLSPCQPQWANYPRGVVAGFIDRGIMPPSIDSTLLSNVPLGGGLSSSAAVEVAIATLLELAGGVDLEPRDKARLCQKAEHDFAGVPCGIMDQFICVFGDSKGALLIDCRDEKTRIIPFSDDGACLLVANTNVRHSLAAGEYGIRRSQCSEAARKLGLASLRDATLEMLCLEASGLSEVEVKRAKHVIAENERTLRAADALATGDLACVGQLMAQSHESLRDDFEVSCRELDVLVDSALAMGQNVGVFGARMTGGGFRGCTITLVRTECVREVQTRIDNDYRRIVGRPITSFVSRPAQGARRLAPSLSNPDVRI